MKRLSILALMLLSTIVTFAQVKTPAPSPGASVSQTFGLTNVEVSYSRPSLRGRVPFVDVESYGSKWRTGANGSTTFTFDTDVMLGGKKVVAGTYAIYTIPGKTEWTIVFNSETGFGGNTGSYKDANDVAKFTAKANNNYPVMAEAFEISFSDVQANEVTVNLHWGKINVPFKITADTDGMVKKQIEQFEKGPLRSVANSYADVASFYLDKKINLDKAVSHINEAIKIRPEAFWWVHLKARIHAAKGDKAGAIATAKKSLAMAKEFKAGDFGYIARNEALIKSLK